MILNGSRYASSTQAIVADSQRGGSFLTIFPLTQQPDIYRGQQFHYYTVVDGDRYDLLASRFYQNQPDLWWVIANANPEILYPDELPAGQIIRIPV